MIYHLRGDTSTTPVIYCNLCMRSVSQKTNISTWWEIEPKDKLVFQDTSISVLCHDCREHEEFNWILNASIDQLLLAINYEWCPQRNSFPRYLSSVKDFYTRRLSGETFPPSLKFDYLV